MTAAAPRRLLLALVAAVCAVAALAPSAALAGDSNGDGVNDYFVWACGSTGMPAPASGAADYRTKNGIFKWTDSVSLFTPTGPNPADSSVFRRNTLCPSDAYYGDDNATADLSGIYQSVTADNGCDPRQAPSAVCFPADATASTLGDITYTTPSQTFIPRFQARWGGRAAIPYPTTSYAVPGLSAYQWRPVLVNQSGVQANIGAEREGAGGLNYTAQNCDGDRTGWWACRWTGFDGFSTYNTGDVFPGQSTISAMRLRLDCDPSHSVAGFTNRCPRYAGTFTNGWYAGRTNLRAIRLYVSDPVAPSLTVRAADLGDQGVPAFRGSGHYLEADATDNTSPRRISFSFTRDANGQSYRSTDAAADCGANEVRTADGSYANTWLNSDPCSDISAARMDLPDTTTLPDGTYTAKAVAYDLAGNASTAWSRQVTVDNCAPGDDCGGVPYRCGPVGITAPDGPNPAYPAWLKGTVAVTAKACDSGSGIAQAKIQFSLDGGGSWDDLCTDNTQTNPGETHPVSCNFDTVRYSTPEYGYAQGQQVHFRLWLKDRAQPSGNTATTSKTQVRYMDNTAPTVGAVTFSMGNAYKRWDRQPSPAGWTNVAAVTAEWPTVPTGGGSPIESVKSTWQPGPACPTSSTSTMGATATSQTVQSVVTSLCNEQGAQGRHTLTVWARDVVGNEINAAPYRSIGQYDFDNVIPDLGGAQAIKVSPSNWSRTNAFQVSFKSPTFNGITEAPTARVEWTLGESDVFKRTSCQSGGLGSAQQCTIGSTDPADPNALKVPKAGGQYPWRVWARDEAGNASRESSAIGVLRYDDACLR